MSYSNQSELSVCTTSLVMGVHQWAWMALFSFWRHISPDKNRHLCTLLRKGNILDIACRKIMEIRPNSHSNVVHKSVEDCAICLEKIQGKKTLKCLHSFCSECIDAVFKFKPACPICNTYHGKYTGNQPNGTMTVTHSWQKLPGFERFGTIVIHYNFQAGTQGVRFTIEADHRGFLPRREVILIDYVWAENMFVFFDYTFQLPFISFFLHQGPLLFVSHWPIKASGLVMIKWPPILFTVTLLLFAGRVYFYLV